MGGRIRPPEWEREDRRQRAVLVGVDSGDREWPVEESLGELTRLAETFHCDVVAQTFQRVDRIRVHTLLGPGKIEEVVQLAKSFSADLVIIDGELTPRQDAALADSFGDVRVMDRTGLILQIFAEHAASKEGKLQVELAQLEYLLPRLRGMWGHLVKERLGGGKGAIFGAGESQLETDRRLVRKRISVVRSQLKRVASSRATQRSQRRASGVFRIALVGYTNAGKSTLMNALTGSDVIAYDMLFATLDSTTRRLVLPDGRTVTLTDTVGFINKLPHGLVEAFKSTLDEVGEADLLLHVIDASHSQAIAQANAVRGVLADIGADDVLQIEVLNKIDQTSDDQLARLTGHFDTPVSTSGLTGVGLDVLVDRIIHEAARASRVLNLVIPYTRGDIVMLAYEQAHVIAESHNEIGTNLTARVPSKLLGKFEEFTENQQG
ncbi:MAG: GTPase HflX [Actinobacteria bacterium]|nr:GTPase HflX [Actinomycetota bacterium]MCL5887596.1 GTPase HflX [Actinomycetota bacterium]